MFFQLQVFIYSVFFYVFLRLLISKPIKDSLEYLSSSQQWLIIVIYLAAFVYFFHISKKISKKISMAPMPVVFVMSTVGLLSFVQSHKQENLLIILSTVAYYFMHIAFYRLRQYEKDKTAKGIIAAGSLATIFLFYAVCFGIYLNFAISLWILMASLMIVTTLVSFQYFSLVNEEEKNVLNYSLVLGFVMAEIVWATNFWPFGYLTTGVINLIFYYVFWDMVQCHFSNHLSKKRVILNMIFFGFLVAMVLSSTRWLPIV